MPFAAIAPALHTYPMQECLRVEKLPWVFLEKRESLFIIVTCVLLAGMVVGESSDVSDERLGDAAAGARIRASHVRTESKEKNAHVV